MAETVQLSRALRLGAPIYYRGLQALGLPAAHRRFRDAGLILCYHNVVGTHEAARDSTGLHLTCERFERQMRWVADRYAVVSLREFVDRLESGASLRSLAAITFDDGYAGVFEQAVPILRGLGIPATVFVVARSVGRRTCFWWDHPEIDALGAGRSREWLITLRGDGDDILARHTRSGAREGSPLFRAAGWNVIADFAGAGIDIGAHSATHRSLTRLGDEELESEIAGSRDLIHEAIGIRPSFFAYPYGLWNARVRAIVQSSGYAAALTLDPGLNGHAANPWSLRRVNIPAGISDAAFEAWTSGWTWSGRIGTRGHAN